MKHSKSVYLTVVYLMLIILAQAIVVPLIFAGGIARMWLTIYYLLQPRRHCGGAVNLRHGRTGGIARPTGEVPDRERAQDGHQGQVASRVHETRPALAW